jgi:tRNA (cytidine/uridine-2'-O-)-methyltransferase
MIVALNLNNYYASFNL